MLERLICLAFLSLFATSVLVAYVQADDTESGEERQQPAELTALKKVMLEAMNMGAESENKAPDNIDNIDTETDKDSATQTSSATASATASTSESVSESAASPATKPDPE